MRTLAYIPSPSQGVWHLGWLPIRAYALFIIIGIVVALIVGDRRWAARGGEPGVIYDIALWAVPFGLVGGRLYHVMTDWRTYFAEGGAGAVAALKIWDGGLGIWGAVALGALGAWIGCRRRGIPLAAFGDAIAPGIILAQAIGRLGNYFNQELYGRETTLPWGLEIFYRRDPSGLIDVHSLDGVSTGQVAQVVHPTFLYELLWNLLVFVVLIYADRRFKLGHGRLFALYVAGYCLGRFWVELMRSDAATHIAGIRINSFTSTFVFIGAVVYMMVAPKGREDPATLGGLPAETEEEVKAPVEPVKAAAAAETTEPEDLQDSTLVEWTKELAAVSAAGGGIVAAATVAAQEEEKKAAGDDGDGESAQEEISDSAPSPADTSPEPLGETDARAGEDVEPGDEVAAEPGVVETEAVEAPAAEGAAVSEVHDEEPVGETAAPKAEEVGLGEDLAIEPEVVETDAAEAAPADAAAAAEVHDEVPVAEPIVSGEQVRAEPDVVDAEAVEAPAEEDAAVSAAEEVDSGEEAAAEPQVVEAQTVEPYAAEGAAAEVHDEEPAAEPVQEAAAPTGEGVEPVAESVVESDEEVLPEPQVGETDMAEPSAAEGAAASAVQDQEPLSEALEPAAEQSAVESADEVAAELEAVETDAMGTNDAADIEAEPAAPDDEPVADEVVEGTDEQTVENESPDADDEAATTAHDAGVARAPVEQAEAEPLEDAEQPSAETANPVKALQNQVVDHVPRADERRRWRFGLRRRRSR